VDRFTVLADKTKAKYLENKKEKKNQNEERQKKNSLNFKEFWETELTSPTLKLSQAGSTIALFTVANWYLHKGSESFLLKDMKWIVI
jgi:hypothetical protein